MHITVRSSQWAPGRAGNLTLSMARTALALDPVFENHETAPGHPESPDRIRALIAKLEPLAAECSRIVPKPAEAADVELCHSPAYVREVLRTIQSGAGELAGGDVSVGPDSGNVALLAVGTALAATDAVINGEAGNAFCAVRPPGHHARPEAAMGFCIFNNVAIAAQHALTRRGLARVAIVDWDVHHGNGTQEIFYESGEVLFFSTHQSPWYPGTGRASETGRGAGEGLTLNRPFPAGSGGKEILSAFRDDLLPALKKFAPQMIFISAGFDSRAGDPLGQFRLTDADFAEMTRLLCEVAGEHCGGRIVSLLEGGYNTSGLASAAAAHLQVLATA